MLPCKIYTGLLFPSPPCRRYGPRPECQDYVNIYFKQSTVLKWRVKYPTLSNKEGRYRLLLGSLCRNIITLAKGGLLRSPIYLLVGQPVKQRAGCFAALSDDYKPHFAQLIAKKKSITPPTMGDKKTGLLSDKR